MVVWAETIRKVGREKRAANVGRPQKERSIGGTGVGGSGREVCEEGRGRGKWE